jgi:hypothetical protein
MARTWSKPEVVQSVRHRVEDVGVAVGPHHYAALVWTQIPARGSPSAFRGRIMTSIRRTRGSQFGKPHRLSGARGSNPRVGIASDGETVVTWIGRQHRPHAAIRRPGETWGTPIRLGDARILAMTEAVGADGTTVALWIEGGSRPKRVVAAVKPSHGAFGPPQRLSSDPELRFGVFFGAAAAGNGRGAVAWDSRCPAPTRVALLQANGSFAAPQTIANSQCASDVIRVAVDDAGGAIALISGYLDNQYVRASIRPPGGGFPPARRISEGVSVNGELAMSREGRAAAIWGLFRQRGTPIGIAASVREPGGSFGSPRRISDRTGGGLEDLAMNRRGEAIAVWQSIGSFRLKASFLPIGGSFGAPERVSRRLSDETLADPTVAINQRGAGLVAWARPGKGGSQRGVFVSTRPRRSH